MSVSLFYLLSCFRLGSVAYLQPKEGRRIVLRTLIVRRSLSSSPGFPTFITPVNPVVVLLSSHQLVNQIVMSSIPSFLWNSYIDYLWNYDSNSWVATIAYAFRIWAILAILPTLVLALLVRIVFLSFTRRSPTTDTITGRDLLCHRTHARRPDCLDLPQIPICDAATSQVGLQNCQCRPHCFTIRPRRP